MHPLLEYEFGSVLACLVADEDETLAYSILWALDLYLLHQLVPNDSYDPQSEPCGSTCNATVLTVNYVETKTQRYRLLLLPVLGVMGSIGTFSYALYKSISEKEGIDGGSDYMSVIWVGFVPSFHGMLVTVRKQ